MIKQAFLIIVGVIMMLLAKPIWADTVLTKDGIRLEGQVQEDKPKYLKIKTTDRGPWQLSRFYSSSYDCANKIYLEPKVGVVYIPKIDVLRLEKSSDAARKKARESHTAGLAALKKEDIESAVANFQAAIKADPKFPDAYIELADVLRYYKKDVNGAMTQLKKAIKLEPDNFLAHFGLAYCYHDLSVYQKDEKATESAIAEYRKTLSLNPGYAHVELKFSAILLRQEGLSGMTYHNANAGFITGRLSAVKTDYEKILQENPNHAGAHAHLGIILYSEGKKEEAITHLEEAVKQGDQDALTAAYLGHAYFHSNPPKLPEAIDQYKKTLELAATAPLCTMQKILVLDGLSMAHGMSKEYDEAEKRAKEILEFKPDYTNAHYNLACVNAERGKKKEACANLESAFKLALESQELKKMIETTENDSSLAGLKDFPNFKKLLETYKKKTGTK